MIFTRPTPNTRLPLRSALTAALLIGAAHHPVSAHEARAQDRIAAELRKGNTAKAVELGEAAVTQAPQDAGLRAQLGHAYLRAGRFEAAASALGDALALGDGAPRNMLVLALAQLACGQNRAALATLDHAGNIPPADMGLALALAGETGRGIALLTDAVRDGPPSANLRQNLAYAYALDGRWADATLTAGMDLPPDQVNARLQQWAQSMEAGGERTRIARLLNVPLIADSGMPAALALNASVAAPAASMPVTPPAVAAITEPLPATLVPVVAAPPVAVAMAQAPVIQALVQAHDARQNFGHFVQLGAYHSYRNAERGRLVLAKRHAQIRGHGLMITQATVRGRAYWYVVLASATAHNARTTCSSLRRNGAACFAYSVRPTRQRPALAMNDLAGAADAADHPARAGRVQE